MVICYNLKYILSIIVLEKQQIFSGFKVKKKILRYFIEITEYKLKQKQQNSWSCFCVLHCSGAMAACLL